MTIDQNDLWTAAGGVPPSPARFTLAIVLPLIVFTVGLGGCASVPAPVAQPDRIGTPEAAVATRPADPAAVSSAAPGALPVEPGTPIEPGAPIAPAVPASNNAAVVALLNDAQTAKNAGRYDSAAATVERALRIEPRNPALWQQLARIRFEEGNFPQAESLALRSNAWAGGNRALRVENWRLIAEARSRRGDEKGARAALDQAARYER